MTERTIVISEPLAIAIDEILNPLRLRKNWSQNILRPDFDLVFFTQQHIEPIARGIAQLHELQEYKGSAKVLRLFKPLINTFTKIQDLLKQKNTLTEAEKRDLFNLIEGFNATLISIEKSLERIMLKEFFQKERLILLLQSLRIALDNVEFEVYGTQGGTRVSKPRKTKEDPVGEVNFKNKANSRLGLSTIRGYLGLSKHHFSWISGKRLIIGLSEIIDELETTNKQEAEIEKLLLLARTSAKRLGLRIKTKRITQINEEVFSELLAISSLLKRAIAIYNTIIIGKTGHHPYHYRRSY
jgi:hypothetical protein